MTSYCHVCKGNVGLDEILSNITTKLTGDVFLRSICGNCSPKGKPCLYRLYLSWVDVVHLILFHMINSKECENNVEGMKFFHWRNICEEIESHWNILWDRDSSGHWQTSVPAALSTYAGKRFKSGKEIQSSLAGFWTLIDNVPPANFEPSLERREEYYFDPTNDGILVSINNNNNKNEKREDRILRQEKESTAKDDYNEREAKKLRREMKKLAASYVFSNLDFDRPNPTDPIAISQLVTHTASQLEIIDKWTISLNKNKGKGIGYCIARTTHGIDRPGKWYFEVLIERGPVRIGVAQILAQTQAPVGFDEYGYGIRSKDGSIVHCGLYKKYAKAFDQGSTVGILIDLPLMDQSPATNYNPELEWPPLKLGQYKVKQEPSQSGTVTFFIDGKEFGVAFENIYLGKYYPAISLYGDAQVKMNIGPVFKYPLPLSSSAVSELATTF